MPRGLGCWQRNPRSPHTTAAAACGLQGRLPGTQGEGYSTLPLGSHARATLLTAGSLPGDRGTPRSAIPRTQGCRREGRPGRPLPRCAPRSRSRVGRRLAGRRLGSGTAAEPAPADTAWPPPGHRGCSLWRTLSTRFSPAAGRLPHRPRKRARRGSRSGTHRGTDAARPCTPRAPHESPLDKRACSPAASQPPGNPSCKHEKPGRRSWSRLLWQERKPTGSGRRSLVKR